MTERLAGRAEWARRAQGLFTRSLEMRGEAQGFRSTKKDTVGELYIYDAIGEDWTGGGVTAKSVQKCLGEMVGEVDELKVYINSPGGSIFEGKAIYNQLARFDAVKTVYVDGIAASAASWIAMVGDRIITMAGGTWMIHNASGGAWGFSEDLRAVADVLDMLTKDAAEIYSKRTGQKVDDLLQWMGDETWMTAAEAKERGFTDEVMEPERKKKGDDDPEERGPLVSSVEMTAKVIRDFSSPHVKVALARNKAKQLGVVPSVNAVNKERGR